MYDIVVIGVGVLGCSIVRELSNYPIRICALIKCEAVCDLLTAKHDMTDDDVEEYNEGESVKKAITCPYGVTIALNNTAYSADVKFLINEELIDLVKIEEYFQVFTTTKVIETRYVINGLGDVIHNMVSETKLTSEDGFIIAEALDVNGFFNVNHSKNTGNIDNITADMIRKSLKIASNKINT